MTPLLRRLAVLFVGSLVTAIGACTQDFDQFEPGASSGFGGAGAGAVASVSSGPSSSGAGATTTSSSGASTASSTASSGGGSAGCPGGFTCVPAIAAGQYAVAAPSDAPCPAGWGNATSAGDGNDPGCSACSCGAPQGGNCDPGDVHRHANPNCTGQQANSGNLADGDCVDVMTGASGFSVDPPTASGGSCEPSASNPLPIAHSTLCTASAGDACGAGMVCVPTSAAPFGDACNLLPGSANCPADLPTKTTLFTSETDTRDCACACGDAQSQACAGGGIQLFADNVCGGAALIAIDADGTCANTAALDLSSSFEVAAGTWSAASCAAQDDHTGDVAFDDEVTLCCPN